MTSDTPESRAVAEARNDTLIDDMIRRYGGGSLNLVGRGFALALIDATRAEERARVKALASDMWTKEHNAVPDDKRDGVDVLTALLAAIDGRE
jgi:hypothetical protein